MKANSEREKSKWLKIDLKVHSPKLYKEKCATFEIPPFFPELSTYPPVETL